MTPAELTKKFQGRGPLIHIVLDGWGIGAGDETDAMFQAQLPTMRRITSRGPYTNILAHGLYVGLPSENDLGGSEVGHMTMGAGMVLEQGSTYIKQLIESGEFFKNAALRKLIKNCLDHQTPLHLVGLLSDGNIHSHIDHYIAFIRHAFASGVRQLYLHALLDGRDVPIQSALEYTSVIEKLFHELHSQRPEIDYAFASGGGREVITMDRDQVWSRVEAGWNVHVRGESPHRFDSIEDAILHFRKKQPDIIDQAIPGFVLVRDGQPVGPIQDHHSVILVNFRADRALEFTHALIDEDFPHFDRSPRPAIEFAGMTIYDQDLQLPPDYMVGAIKVDNPFGKRILELGKTQFRLTETQKFPHITFFYNGGYREPLDPAKETYHLIDSDKLDSFDLKPQMKAREIGEQAVAYILSKNYDYGLINFANADMVGHSGNFKATIQALETVDQVLEQITKAIDQVNGLLVITADHGNADQMLYYNKHIQRWEPNTKHSLNPIPFVIYDPLYQGEYTLQPLTDKNHLNLSHVAATNFILMGEDVPSDINTSLFQLD